MGKKKICKACEKGDCKNCTSSFTCDCECNIHGASDIAQKGLSILGGIGMVAGGLALTIGTGGLAVFAGGAMIGAGMSSTFQGVEKSIKNERLSAGEYCGDVAFGALTGVITGGVGAAGEVVVGKVATEGVKQVAVRAGTGAVSGLAAKTVSEVKACTTGEKEWSEFGKAYDKNGDCSVRSTVTSWTTSAVTGSLGGAASHLSSNASSVASSNIAKVTTRVAISGGAACTADAVSQGINIAAGNQEEYSIKQTVLSGTTSAITTAAMEGMKSGIYAASGGKEQLVEDKTNKKMIEKNVPAEDKDKALKAYDELKKIPSSEMKTEIGKAKEYTEQKQLTDMIDREKKLKLSNINSEIKRHQELRQEAINKKDLPAIKTSQNELDKLMNEKQTINKPNEAVQTVKKDQIGHIGSVKAHPLTGNKINQIAVDVGGKKATGSPISRGAKRMVFDAHEKSNGQLGYRYSDYTKDHNYESTKNYGEQTEFIQTRSEIHRNLNISEKVLDMEQKILNANFNGHHSDDEDDEIKKHK